MNTDDKKRDLRTDKTIKQKIASAQMRFNRLKSKEKSLSNRAETRLKIILGAEVAKAVNSNASDIDKPLVLGYLLDISRLSTKDKHKYRSNGLLFLSKFKFRNP